MTLNEKHKQLSLLREERINKAKMLYKFVDELRNEMTNNGQMLPSKEFDPIADALKYANLLELKNNYEKDHKEELSDEKYETIVSKMNNMENELFNTNNNSYTYCEFEEYVKDNLKYLDLNKISEEIQNFNPFTYNMRNELFYICYTHLCNVVSSNIRDENKLYYDELIKHFISIQSTIVNLLDVRLQIEKEEREIKLVEEDKISPSETLYIENYMNVLKEKLGLFILNTMKQNMIVLSRKLYYSAENEVSFSKLLEEFGMLYEEVLIYISSYDPSLSLCALPDDYAKTIIPQIELIKTFILPNVEECYKR